MFNKQYGVSAVTLFYQLFVVMQRSPYHYSSHFNQSSPLAIVPGLTLMFKIWEGLTETFVVQLKSGFGSTEQTQQDQRGGHLEASSECLWASADLSSQCQLYVTKCYVLSWFIPKEMIFYLSEKTWREMTTKGSTGVEVLLSTLEVNLFFFNFLN